MLRTIELMRFGFSHEPWRRFFLRSWHNWVMRGIAALAVVGFSVLLVADEADETWKIILAAAAALSAGNLTWKAHVTLTPTTISLWRGPRDPGVIIRDSILSVTPTGADGVEVAYRRRRLGVGSEYTAQAVLILDERDAFLRALEDVESVRDGVDTPFWPVNPATVAGLSVAITALVIGLGWRTP
jgi:hypothetical protein